MKGFLQAKNSNPKQILIKLSEGKATFSNTRKPLQKAATTKQASNKIPIENKILMIQIANFVYELTFSVRLHKICIATCIRTCQCDVVLDLFGGENGIP